MAQVPDIGMFARVAGVAVVRVGRGDDSVLEGIDAHIVLDLQALDQTVANEGVAAGAAVLLAGRAGRDGIFESAFLIAEAHARHAFGRALDLENLDQRLDPCPAFENLLGPRRAVGVLAVPEEPAPGIIDVVRDREDAALAGAVLLHPLVHLLAGAVIGAESLVRDHVAAEDDVAMEHAWHARPAAAHVGELCGRRVGRKFVAEQRGELAGLVVAVGIGAHLCPQGVRGGNAQAAILVADFGHSLAGGDAGRELGESGHRIGAHSGAHFGIVGFRTGRGAHADLAKELGVVGDRHEIERTVELTHLPAIEFHRLALRKAIGLVRPDRIAEDEAVERVAGMDMQFAEPGVLERVGRDSGFLGGPAMLLDPGCIRRPSAELREACDTQQRRSANAHDPRRCLHHLSPQSALRQACGQCARSCRCVNARCGMDSGTGTSDSRGQQGERG